MITFTNAAAEEISERLGQPKGVFIGTIHSYANYLLLSRGEETKDLLLINIQKIIDLKGEKLIVYSNNVYIPNDEEFIENNKKLLGTKPLVDAEAGKRALELVLAIYKSAAEGHPVKLPLIECSTMDFVVRFNK